MKRSITNYYEIKENLKISNLLFEDPEFLPHPRNLCQQVANIKVDWLRPYQICQNPFFIKNGLSRFDLDQGRVGNCWFIAATATLACKKDLFLRCVPEDQSFHRETYYGIFHFNFWHYGKWVEILIDDKLPCFNGKLLFCHNRIETNEFWSALFEKAYAKLYGGYGQLDGGRLSNALVDFTGGITESIFIGNKTEIPSDIFNTLYACTQMNSFMGCSIDGDYRKEELLPNGLYKGHAYSITAVEWVIRKGFGPVRLIRLMNPWGRGEWKGKWSDRSSLWKNVDSTELKRLDIRNCEDGEFWMSYEDWIDNFQRLEVVHLEPDAFTDSLLLKFRKNKWVMFDFYGEWILDKTAGGCGNPPYKPLFETNPQYSIIITEEEGCCIIISLLQIHVTANQTEEDFKSSPTYNAISFHTFKVRRKYETKLTDFHYPKAHLERVVDPPTFVNTREITQRIDIKGKGIYIVIPCTYMPFVEGKFLLRIFIETDTRRFSSSLPKFKDEPEPDPKEKEKKDGNRLYDNLTYVANKLKNFFFNIKND